MIYDNGFKYLNCLLPVAEVAGSVHKLLPYRILCDTLILLHILILIVYFHNNLEASTLLIKFQVCLDPGERQALVDYLGENLGVTYTTVRNGNGSVLEFEAEIELKNNGDETIASPDWELYLCHIRLIEPATIRPDGAELGSSGFKAFHINGCQHKIVPSVGFTEIQPGESVTIAFHAQYWQVAITDVMPNWYVVTSGATPAVIKSTAGESLDFVTPLTKPEQVTRVPGDLYKPWTPEDRFDLNANITNVTTPDIEVVPTPLEVAIDASRRVTFNSQWVVVQTRGLAEEANVLVGNCDVF